MENPPVEKTATLVWSEMDELLVQLSAHVVMTTVGAVYAGMVL